MRDGPALCQASAVRRVRCAPSRLCASAPSSPLARVCFHDCRGGGPNRYALICDTVTVVRVTDTLVEIAFIDSTNTPLQHEHHLIMVDGVSGLYGYDIMKATAAYGLNEVRACVRVCADGRHAAA